ncbi:hypothetical protein RND81_09G175400 [Saponaria officinalis]|uniref:SWI/SNF complex subunit SWI3D n=1 Tax=Saponaria officinalis TaxID=3572 RepID=A0AAW1INV4_SAPOF
MEDKRRDAGSPSPAATISGGSSAKSGESPATEPPASRRRGQKRKSTASINSGSSSAPPKRHLREKAAAAAAAASATVGISSLFSPFHNGPLTRARQLSDTNAVLNAVKEEEETAMAAMRDNSVDVVVIEEVDLRSEEFKAFEADIEAEFNSIRSRSDNSHVVPVAAGWFSWTKFHPIEKQALQSFFNGKSEIRTPEVYMEIRNWIMKRFHAKPNTDIELKDLLELSSGDSDAKQEVLEFLDHWGLINYHPFPQNDTANTDSDPNKTEKTDSLIKKLFQFENEKSFLALVPKANSSQTISNGLLRESALAEEFIKQEGPAVEYHCNSCSADCSRKRYHCQKQADFDLCTECFNNGKFGSGMSSSDFILMEPGDSSASGGKWTDQETLLLLEALELFKENWNEIAEHVATKTKAQCILHFLQMPIEDGFLDDDYDTKDSVKDMAEPTLTSNDVSDQKDNLEPSEEKTSEDNPDQIGSRSGMDNSELSPPKSAKDDAEPSDRNTVTDAAQPDSTPMETSIIEEAQDGKLTQENGDEVIHKALMEAFGAVGGPVAPQDNLCFAEAGNSVMALAAFLAQLVDPNLAMASAHSSLKSISKSSPGSQLAARHCFILEDPPDDKNEQTMPESTTTEKPDQNAQKVVTQEGENDKIIPVNKENFTNMDVDKSTTVLRRSNSADDQNDEKKSSDPRDNQRLPSAGQNVLKDKPKLVEKLDKEKVEGVENPIETPQVAEKPNKKKSNKDKSGGLEEPNKDKSKIAEKQNKTTTTEQVGSKGVTEPANCIPQSDQSRPDDQDDSSSKGMPPPSSSDESGSMHPAKEAGQFKDGSKGIDMETSCAVLDKMDQQETVSTDPVVGVGSETGVDEMKVDKSGDLKSRTASAVDDNVAKLKRAALATLSAAAVKAKLLADHEEDEIKQLATVLIEKQLRKLEIKLSFFTEMEGTIMRVRELLERSKQKLFAERAQIIASRLGLPASARGMASSHPLNRMPAGLLNSVLRPSMNMAAQRPPLSRSVMASTGPTTNTSAPPEVAGYGSGPPMAGEKPSTVGTD